MIQRVSHDEDKRSPFASSNNEAIGLCGLAVGIIAPLPLKIILDSRARRCEVEREKVRREKKRKKKNEENKKEKEREEIKKEETRLLR